MLRIERLLAGEQQIEFRPITPSDTDFLRAVYRSTREEELAPVPWSEAQKSAFVAQQFAAQTDAYVQNYPGAQFLLLRVDATDAGRCYLHERRDEIRIMDIALLPPFRKRGIGAAVLRHILQHGVESKRAVTIHVEVFNPAMRLYQRLGFREVSRTEVYALMEWRPADERPATPGG